jgi:hypothetical protein
LQAKNRVDNRENNRAITGPITGESALLFFEEAFEKIG